MKRKRLDFLEREFENLDDQYSEVNQKAAAWDEGYEDRRADEHEHRPGRKITNPYKEES